LYTIFGLLFWDIIFAPIAGAFETRFQLAPLDIAHETFYSSRQDIIQDRLKEIRDGKAAEILGAADSKYREKKTCCVGVRWDDFERQDLLDLVDVCARSHSRVISQSERSF
jgi:fanconi-associated nuclease 1